SNPLELWALKTHEAERILVFRPSLMPFARYLAPGTQIEVLVLEPSVGMGLRVDLSEVDALGHGYGRAEYIVAADHQDFICPGLLRGASGQRDRFIQARRHNGAGRREIGIARQHDVEALVENLGKRLKGAAAHDDRLAKRNFAELLEIGRQPPGKSASDADGAVLGPRHDKGNHGIAGGPLRPTAQTATLA